MCPARGASVGGDSVVYQAPLRRKRAEVGGRIKGKVGYRLRKHMHMTSVAPMTITAPPHLSSLSKHTHTNALSSIHYDFVMILKKGPPVFPFPLTPSLLE